MYFVQCMLKENISVSPRHSKYLCYMLRTKQKDVSDTNYWIPARPISCNPDGILDIQKIFCNKFSHGR